MPEPRSISEDLDRVLREELLASKRQVPDGLQLKLLELAAPHAVLESTNRGLAPGLKLNDPSELQAEHYEQCLRELKAKKQKDFNAYFSKLQDKANIIQELKRIYRETDSAQQQADFRYNIQRFASGKLLRHFPEQDASTSALFWRRFGMMQEQTPTPDLWRLYANCAQEFEPGVSLKQFTDNNPFLTQADGSGKRRPFDGLINFGSSAISAINKLMMGFSEGSVLSLQRVKQRLLVKQREMQPYKSIIPEEIAQLKGRAQALTAMYAQYAELLNDKKSTRRSNRLVRQVLKNTVMSNVQRCQSLADLCQDVAFELYKDGNSKAANELLAELNVRYSFDKGVKEQLEDIASKGLKDEGYINAEFNKVYDQIASNEYFDAYPGSAFDAAFGDFRRRFLRETHKNKVESFEAKKSLLSRLEKLKMRARMAYHRNSTRDQERSIRQGALRKRLDKLINKIESYAFEDKVRARQKAKEDRDKAQLEAKQNIEAFQQCIANLQFMADNAEVMQNQAEEQRAYYGSIGENKTAAEFAKRARSYAVMGNKVRETIREIWPGPPQNYAVETEDANSLVAQAKAHEFAGDATRDLVKQAHIRVQSMRDIFAAQRIPVPENNAQPEPSQPQPQPRSATTPSLPRPRRVLN